MRLSSNEKSLFLLRIMYQRFNGKNHSQTRRVEMEENHGQQPCERRAGGREPGGTGVDTAASDRITLDRGVGAALSEPRSNTGGRSTLVLIFYV